MGKLLLYKGIKFDWWQTTEEGLVFSEMCYECASKAFPNINLELDSGDAASACCGVLGCSNRGDTEDPHYYIDFDDTLVEFVDDGVREAEHVPLP